MGVLKSIEIGGTDLSLFNCRLCGPAIYDAPERDVTKVSIPGRSGDLILDNGRFKNVSGEFDCLIESNDAVRDFEELKSWLKSLRGYQRIEEEFHPGEYRMGEFYAPITYKAADRKGISFKLNADCKPQRFLMEGEHEYGNIIPAELNEEWTGQYRTPNIPATSSTVFRLKPTGDLTDLSVDDCTIENLWNAPSLPANAVATWKAGNYVDLTGFQDDTVFCLFLSTAYTWLIETDAVSGQTECYTIKANDPVINNTYYEASPLFVIRAVDDDISLSSTYFIQFIVNGIRVRVLRTFVTEHSDCTLYIDSEVQDCYFIEDGIKKNANAYVSLVDESTGAVTTDFPKFAPGKNTITYAYQSTLYYNPLSAMTYIPRWYTI